MTMRMVGSGRLVGAGLLTLTMLAGCAKPGELVLSDGVGITAVRTACPAVGIPDYTGDITTFRSPAAGATADNIDVVAAMTNVRPTCNESGDKVYSQASFDVLARRTDTRGARRVELPYFVTVLRGGSAVVSKRVGTVVLDFAHGQERARASAQAGAYIDRAEATLPAEIRERITRERRAGDQEAAVDPMTEPEVRAALARASFELLVGFHLTDAQLGYNATR